MNTDSDLRALFADEANDIGEPAELLARLTVNQSMPPAAPTRLRGRWVAPVAAAAAVVTVASAALAISATRHQADAGAGSHTLPPMPGRELGYTISVGVVSGYDTSDSSLEPDREVTEVISPAASYVTAGEVVAYPPGGFDPTEVRRGRPVTVQGHQGYFGRSIYSADQEDAITNPTHPETLAWEAAPDRWIVVQGWDATGSPPLRALHLDPFTEEMRVAKAVDTSTTKPLLLPYRVGYLPAGLRHGGGRATPLFGRWHQWLESELWFNGAGQSGSGQHLVWKLSIGVRPKLDSDKPVDGSLTINGHPAQYRPRRPVKPITVPTITVSAPAPSNKKGPTQPKRKPLPTSSTFPPPGTGLPPTLTVDFGNTLVGIQGDYSKDEMVRIARSMTLAADVKNPATWFDAAK